MRVGLGDALPHVVGHLRDVGLGAVAQVEQARGSATRLLRPLIGNDIEDEGDDAVLHRPEVEVGADAHERVCLEESANLVAQLEAVFAAGGLVANQHAGLLVLVRFEEVAAVGNGDTHHLEEVPPYDIGLQGDAPSLVGAAPSHTAYVDQLSVGRRDVDHARVGQQPAAQGVIALCRLAGELCSHQIAAVEAHILMQHEVVLAEDESRGDDETHRDGELEAQQQRAQPPAAGRTGEGPLDHHGGRERGDVPCRIEARHKSHDHRHGEQDTDDRKVLRHAQRCGDVAGQLGALDGEGEVPGQQQGDEDQPHGLEDEAEAQRGVRGAEDLEGVDRTDTDGHQRQEEVDEVDEGQRNDQQGDAQQRVGRHERPLRARHAAVGLEVEVADARQTDGFRFELSLLVGLAGIHLHEEPLPLLDDRPGVSSGLEPDVVVVAPLRVVVERHLAQIHDHVAPAHQRVLGKILEDGHHLAGVLGRRLVDVAPEHVADADTELFGRRARDDDALRPFQLVNVARNGLKVEDIEQRQRDGARIDVVETVVPHLRGILAQHGHGAEAAPGAAAGLDGRGRGDEPLDHGPAEPRLPGAGRVPVGGLDQIDALRIGKRAVVGELPAHLRQDDVAGREGERQTHDVEQRRSLVSPQRGEEVSQCDFHIQRYFDYSDFTQSAGFSLAVRHEQKVTVATVTASTTTKAAAKSHQCIGTR